MSRHAFNIDGGGVLRDAPLPWTHLTVALDDNRAHDLSITVADGRLHLSGQYGTLHVERTAPNRLWVASVLSEVRS